MKKKLFLFLFAIIANPVVSQTLYDMNTIQVIEINFTQANWDYMLDTATAGYESDIMANWVKINGVQYDSVGVRYKGNSTYNANQVKNPFHITLDAFKNQDYQGYTDIKLSNVAKDPSFVREVLSYKILRKYMHASLSNYANVFVNGSLIGLYVNSESVSKSFVNNHFYSNDNAFFKCNPPAGAGPGSTAKPNLVNLGTDSTSYYDAYEMKSDYGWADLIALTDSIANNINNVEKILDVDRALWMIAFDNVLVNLDSYIGGFAQNYYLYKDNNKRFNSVVWDLNESFGTFSQTGTLNLSTTTSKQQMTHLLHVNDAAWPLIKQLLAVPKYKRMYIAHMRTILSENFANGSFYADAQALQTLISSSVAADVNKFFTFSQFTNNLTTDVVSGMTNAPGLTNLMNARNTWLNTQTEFTASYPSISNILVSNTSPSINSTVTITAAVTNTNTTGVYLGYRYSIEAAFKRIQMYDDGIHNDGAAGDNVYGVDVPVNASYIHYYIYAENNNAGLFSPERAEFEYYSLFATIPMINAGEVAINELLASNSFFGTDQDGEHDDWIELYNNTSNYVSLKNAYLSDASLTPLKWMFPDNATIAPNSYLIVWADNDTNQAGLHANFKLSATGEQVILSYANGTIVDNITYGVQATDVSYQRCPNGVGSFTATTPTYNSVNCVVGIDEQEQTNAIRMYPNPSTTSLEIVSDEQFSYVEVFDIISKQIAFYSDKTNSLTIDVSSYSNGVYFIKIDGKTVRKIIVEH
jgi:hypothetical protein